MKTFATVLPESSLGVMLPPPACDLASGRRAIDEAKRRARRQRAARRARAAKAEAEAARIAEEARSRTPPPVRGAEKFAGVADAARARGWIR